MILVVALEDELKIVPNLVKNAKKVIITGVGGINVWNALKDESKEQDGVNAGFVGSNILPVGTICYPKEVRLYHPTVDYQEKQLKLEVYKEGNNPICFTSTDFVTKTNIKEPVVFDMELAFIVAMGFRTVKAIKKVSDNLNVCEYERNSNNGQ